MKYILIAGIVVIAVLAGVLVFVDKPAPEPEQEKQTEQEQQEVIQEVIIEQPAQPESVRLEDEEGNVLISLAQPASDQVVTSPVAVKGEARGTWFFEADAPMLLVNWDGLIVGEGHITAQREWMVEDLVPFEGTVEFDEQGEAVTGYSRRGTLILLKANASGLPEFDNALEVPVVLGQDR